MRSHCALNKSLKDVQGKKCLTPPSCGSHQGVSFALGSNHDRQFLSCEVLEKRIKTETESSTVRCSAVRYTPALVAAEDGRPFGASGGRGLGEVEVHRRLLLQVLIGQHQQSERPMKSSKRCASACAAHLRRALGRCIGSVERQVRLVRLRLVELHLNVQLKVVA